MYMAFRVFERSLFLAGGMMVIVLVIGGFGLYRMAKRAGIPSPWLSFLPVGNSYILGLLGERALYCATGKTRRLAQWLLWGSAGGILLWVLCLAFGGIVLIPFIGLLSIAVSVLYYYALYYVYRDYSPGNETLYLILTIVLGGLPEVVLLIVLSDEIPVSEGGPRSAWR